MKPRTLKLSRKKKFCDCLVKALAENKSRVAALAELGQELMEQGAFTDAQIGHLISNDEEWSEITTAADDRYCERFLSIIEEGE